MSVRCSVLGHDLTEKEKEVESEADDSVTIVETVETCSRCDYETTVRENKSVSITEAEAEFYDELGPHAASPEDVETESGATTPAIADGGEKPDDTPLDEDEEEEAVPGDDAVFIGGSDKTPTDETSSPDPDPHTSSRQPTQQPESNSEPEPTGSETTPTTTSAAEDEDAMLLDDSSDETGDSDPFDELEEEFQQQQQSQPGASDEELSEEDVLTPDGTTKGEDDSTFSPGAFNGSIPEDEPDESPAQDDEILTAGDEGVTSTPTPSSGTDSSTSDQSGDDLTCDTCRFSVGREGTPIRIGDICPECRKGYIEQS